MTDMRIVLSTFASDEIAKNIAHQLLEERLIVCVNIIPTVLSMYWWKGKIEEDQEVMTVMKTNESKIQLLMNRLDEIHPYDTPEILSIGVDFSAEKYLKWVSDECEI